MKELVDCKTLVRHNVQKVNEAISRTKFPKSQDWRLSRRVVKLSCLTSMLLMRIMMDLTPYLNCMTLRQVWGWTCDEAELLDVDVVDEDDGGLDRLPEMHDVSPGLGLEHPEICDGVEFCEEGSVG